jgi:hypothetical protein
MRTWYGPGLTLIFSTCGKRMDSADWTQIPGPPGYEPAGARAAEAALTRAASPGHARQAVADLRFAVSNDHRGSLYPAAVPAVSLLLRVIGTMPGGPREEALSALLDWWGTFRPEPGFETYDDPVAGTAEITVGIMRQVRDAVPMLRGVAEEQFKRHRHDAMELLRCLDTGWIPQDLPSAGPGGKRKPRRPISADPGAHS